MELYHGSNVVVKSPRLFNKLRTLDFGNGFYLTSDKNQALKWANIVYRRRKTGVPTLNIYTIDESNFSKFDVLKFDTANGEWLDFVVMNRKNEYTFKKYDIVIGPVANDTTIRIVDDYMAGIYTKEEAIKRLLPQKLTDQYAFLTEEAISFLKFERSENL